jgi:hypothetical protein
LTRPRISLRSTLILPSHLRLGILFHACYMPCPSHPPWLDHSNYIWWRVHDMKLLIVQFSPTSYHFVPLRSNILFSTLFSNTLSLCSSLNAKNQVPHPYKVTGKILVFCILIVTFLDKARRQKVLDWMVASITWNESPYNFFLNQILICYCCSKYLNCATFSEDLLAIFMFWFCHEFWWWDINIYSETSIHCFCRGSEKETIDVGAIVERGFAQGP